MNSTAEKNTLTVNTNSERGFEYPITVFPHDTDYAGIVWHGTYLTWLEEARVECLASIGVAFADFVKIGCDMQVVDISLRYQRPLKLGDKAIIRTHVKSQGIKILWEYNVQSADSVTTYITGTISLVAIDSHKQKIMRRLPPTVQDALAKLLS
jgi:acyl-CoA thioester hydrolase